MNDCIKLISKVYLIILIPLASLLIINNIPIFAEDKQQQNVPIASDAKDLFTFFNNFKNAAGTPSIKTIENPIVIKSPNIKEDTIESPVIKAQNHTMSQDTKVLIMLDIPELKENLIDTKESLADGDIKEALAGILDVENQFLLLQNKTKLTENFQKIKGAISKTDLKKALDYITKIQTAVIKSETEVLKAHLMTKQEEEIIKEDTIESPVIKAQNHTMSQDTKVLIMLDIPELKENLIDTKESLADGDIKEALAGILDVENQFLLLQNKTKLTENFQKIKEAISKTDLKKALDYITKIQTAVIKSETEVLKAHLMTKQEEKNRDTN